MTFVIVLRKERSRERSKERMSAQYRRAQWEGAVGGRSGRAQWEGAVSESAVLECAVGETRSS
jgi:hypothetical protein